MDDFSISFPVEIFEKLGISLHDVSDVKQWNPWSFKSQGTPETISLTLQQMGRLQMFSKLADVFE